MGKRIKPIRKGKEVQRMRGIKRERRNKEKIGKRESKLEIKERQRARG